MSLKYFVHVSSVSNLSDARYCSGMMVDSIGFNLDENSPYKLSIDSVIEISNWINGVKIIAEFNNSSDEYINSILDKKKFDGIQVDLTKSTKRIIKISNENIIVKISDPKLINKHINSYMNKNFPSSNTIFIDNLTNQNKNLLERIDNNFLVVINPYDKINEISSFIEVNNYGLLLKGTDEIRPGLKDYDSLSDYLDSIDNSF